jgi:site-specific recombinase XerD
MKTLQDYLDFPCPLPAVWKECIRDFLIHLYHDYSQSLETVDTYRTMLKQFLSVPGRNLGTISQHDVRTFVRSPSKPHYGNPRGEPSASLQNARTVAIRSFYSFASTYTPHGWNHPIYEKANPAVGLPMRTISCNPKGMDEHVISRFFSVIPSTPIGDRDRAIFLTYLLTARRRAEIVRLNYGDIQPAVFPAENGGRRAGWSYRYRGKGQGLQERVRELPAMAKRAIDLYLERSERIATIQGDDPLFSSFEITTGREHRATHRRLPMSSVAVRMRLYMKEAGIHEHHTIHSFRHTSVQQRYEQGAGILEINDILDHVSLANTKRYLDGLVGIGDSESVLLEKKFAHLLR